MVTRVVPELMDFLLVLLVLKLSSQTFAQTWICTKRWLLGHTDADDE